jgi:hypothetical protein
VVSDFFTPPLPKNEEVAEPDRAKVSAMERALRLGRIQHLMATTPDWQRWFWIDWAHMELHLK